jgi:hypothetical protein
MIAASSVLVEEDDEGGVLGIYIGNAQTTKAFKQLLGRIHLQKKKEEKL